MAEEKVCMCNLYAHFRKGATSVDRLSHDALWSRLSSAALMKSWAREPESASRRGPEAQFTVRLDSSAHELEREWMARTLAFAEGNKARASDILGMSRRNFYNRLERYSVDETNGHSNGRSYRNGRNGLT